MLETSLIVEYQSFLVLRNQRLIQKKLGRIHPPFEYYPGWKVFWARPSGEISLSKRLVLG
ncbi:hypothetical protein AWA1501_02490 [Lactiplantibacillus pentosus]|nr:hypothetical protein AWA1501_02490 [Lactiplantibacillus pentosus]